MLSNGKLGLFLESLSIFSVYILLIADLIRPSGFKHYIVIPQCEPMAITLSD